VKNILFSSQDFRVIAIFCNFRIFSVISTLLLSEAAGLRLDLLNAFRLEPYRQTTEERTLKLRAGLTDTPSYLELKPPAQMYQGWV
jgi:hypothetical protein